MDHGVMESWIRKTEYGIKSWYGATMNTTVTIDKAGRIVLPKLIRDGLRISPGDTLDLDVADDAVTLRPHRAVVPLRKVRGVWVLHTGKPLTTEQTRDAIRASRNQRAGDSLGRSG